MKNDRDMDIAIFKALFSEVIAIFDKFCHFHKTSGYSNKCIFFNAALPLGAQWLSGRVLDSRPKGRGFEPHRRHCVVVLEQDTFILA